MADDEIDFLEFDDDVTTTTTLPPAVAAVAPALRLMRDDGLRRATDDEDEDGNAWAGGGDDGSSNDGDGGLGEESDEESDGDGRAHADHDGRDDEYEDDDGGDDLGDGRSARDGKPSVAGGAHEEQQQQQPQPQPEMRRRAARPTRDSDNIDFTSEQDAADCDSGPSDEPDDGAEWTEADVRALMVKVAAIRDRLSLICAVVVAHPLVWVPVNAAASPLAAGCTPENRPEGSLCYVNGLGKLRHRIDTELRLLAKYISLGEFRRARCNNVRFLEIAVDALEVERGVLFVAVTLPLRASRKVDGVELDIVSAGGLRWIKIRGSSARNLEADVVVEFEDDDGSAAASSAGAGAAAAAGAAPAAEASSSAPSRQPQAKPRGGGAAGGTAGAGQSAFVEVLARLSRASTSAAPPLRLPFGAQPQVVMLCAQQPTRRTLDALERAAPNVRCVVHERGAALRAALPPLDFPIECVNFDVTALVALCADVCNGHAHADFPGNPVLQRQAVSEREGQRCIEHFLAPVLRAHTRTTADAAAAAAAGTAIMSPEVAALIGERAETLIARRKEAALWAAINSELPPLVLLPVEQGGRGDANALGTASGEPANWIAPAAAIEEFAWIVETISGPLERRRALWLMRRVRCVDTARHRLCDRLAAIFSGNSAIKPRQLNVFSCGDSTRAVTLSANRAFLHSAFESGQLMCCCTHPARALTERKRIGGDCVPTPNMYRESNQRPRQIAAAAALAAAKAAAASSPAPPAAAGTP